MERKDETPFSKAKKKKAKKAKITKKPIQIKIGTEILNGTCLIDDDD